MKLPFELEDRIKELESKLAASEQSSKEIERLNALVAMQAEALKQISDGCVMKSIGVIKYSAEDVVLEYQKLADRTLSASSSTVAKWKAEKLLPIQRQVAMLDEFVNHCLNAVDNLNDLPISDEWATKWANKASDMLEKHNWYRAEKATAEAYDREHAAKVLEEAKSTLETMNAIMKVSVPDVIDALQQMADELQNKQE